MSLEDRLKDIPVGEVSARLGVVIAHLTAAAPPPQAPGPVGQAAKTDKAAR